MVGWSHAQVAAPDYSLTVEATPAVAVEGATTYRFYVNMMEDGDRMSAVFGNSATPLVVGVDEGAFNTPQNGSWNAAGLTPALFPLFPELQDDTYATIGLTGPASLSGLGNATDPQLASDDAQPEVQAFFASDGAEELRADSEIGTVWFVLNDASNALPDESMRVLILQITTTGTVDGTLNFQVLPEGPLGLGTDEVRTVSFDGAGVYYDPEFGPVFGCTDPTACNFDAAADVDDGSCEYAAEGFDCAGTCVVGDVDGDGICDAVDDCVDMEAPVWTYFPADDTLSCADPMPDPSMTMPVASDDCGPVSVTWLVDGPFEYPFECLQSYLCPRVYEATDAAGNSIVDTVMFTVLDLEPPVFVFPTESMLAVDELAGEMVPPAEAMVVDACDDNAGYEVLEDTLSNNGLEVVIQRTFTASDACGNTAEFVQTLDVTLALEGCMDPEACNFDAAATSDDGTCEAVSCGGCTDAEACNFDPEASVNDGSCTYTGCSGCTDLLACNFDAGAFLDDGSCVYDGCFGCSDPAACNHDPEAVLVDNANCLYPQDLYGVDHVDCAGLCIHDIDGDGICDEAEEPGCTDPSACNYSTDATDDDGSCLLLDAVGVCGGPCAADANDNGICDALEASLCGPGTEWDAALGQCIEDGPVGTSGCTYVDATNFDAAATIDDGTCLFSVASPCPTDLNGDGVTGSPDLLMILGSYGEACE